ncbi:MAG TPA: hypothetical protein VMV04_11505, partial [Thermodesulfobacteriota bacterium]|nr:hypothetical protein [Thermodesulfobacteriota bacterium]
MLSLAFIATFSTSQAADSPPELPGCFSELINIDFNQIESLRREYKILKGQDGSEEDFKFAWLPAQIFSRILFGDFNAKDLPSDFG